MTNGFLTDIGKTIVIFAAVYCCMGAYIFIKTKHAGDNKKNPHQPPNPLAEVKKQLTSQLSLGLACVAGIMSLLFVDSLPAILTIGGLFMGLLYLIFSKRP